MKHQTESLRPIRLQYQTVKREAKGLGNDEYFEG